MSGFVRLDGPTHPPPLPRGGCRRRIVTCPAAVGSDTGRSVVVAGAIAELKAALGGLSACLTR